MDFKTVGRARNDTIIEEKFQMFNNFKQAKAQILNWVLVVKAKFAKSLG